MRSLLRTHQHPGDTITGSYRAIQKNPDTCCPDNPNKENVMTLSTLLLIVLVLLIIGALPTWPHSRNWGYAPGGGLVVVLVIVAVLVFGGYLR